MSTRSPIFPMPQPQHFTDHGFDPQIDYIQELEEARKHKRDASRSIDSLLFKLQKPISKGETRRAHHHPTPPQQEKETMVVEKRAPLPQVEWIQNEKKDEHENDVIRQAKKARTFRASISGPVYINETLTRPTTTPCRTTSRPTSGLIAGTMTPTRKGDVGVRYWSLRELNMEQPGRISTSAMPIYLVT